MAELLGDALLELRTSDKGYTEGVESAYRRAQLLGQTLDAASGTAMNLAARMTQSGESSEAASKAYAAVEAAIVKLAAAQSDVSALIKTAKASLDAGKISLDKYNEEVLRTKMMLSQVEGEYRSAVTELRKHQDALSQTTQLSGQQRMSLMVLGEQLRQVSTELALGISPAQVFAQQFGQIVDAAQMAVGGTGKFAMFMQGPWGIALTAGAASILPLVATLFESDGKAKELHKSTLDLYDALLRSASGTDAARKALADYNAEQQKARNSTESMIKLNLADAEARLNDALAARHQLEAELARRNQTVKDIRAMGEDTEGAEILAGQMTAKFAENAGKISELETTLRNLRIQDAVRDAKAAVNPIQEINNRYDDMAAKAERAAAGNDALSRSLKATLTEIERRRAADLKAAQETKSASNHQYGREIDLSEAKAIAQGAGFRITDDFRTRADQQRLYDTVRSPANPVAVPGTSAHERGNALDIAFGKGVDVASIRKAFEDSGVRLSKVLTEVGHYHVEWSTAGADKANATAKKAQDDALRNQRDFDQANDQLNAQLLAARRASLTDIDQIARLNTEQLKAEQSLYDDGVEYKVKHKELTRAQGAILELKEAEIIRLKQEAILEDAQAEKLRMQSALDRQLNDHQVAILQAQMAVAKTSEERRKIQLELLDREKEQMRRQYQDVIDQGKLGKASEVDVQAARDGLDKLDATYDLRRKATIEQTAGPLDAYLASMKLTSAQLRERSEGLAVSELEYFRKGLDDAITSRLGIKDPILSALVDEFVQQVLIKPITDALQKLNSSSGGGGGGLLGGLLGSLGGLFGGSGSSLASLTSSAESTISDPAFAGLFADGGLIPSGGWGIVGEAGPEPIFATGGGVGVLPNSALRAMGSGGSSQPGKLEVTVTGARGNAEIQQMVQQGVAQGLAAYDRQVGERVRDNLARRG